MTSNKLPIRKDVPEKDRWDLTPIFSDISLWEEEFKSIEALIKTAESYIGTLSNSGDSLLAALEFRDQLYGRLSRLYVYAHLESDTDLQNTEFQNINARAMALSSKARTAFSFFDPELGEIPQENIQAFMEETKALALYSQEFKEFFLKKPYILSQKEESILAKVSEPLSGFSQTFMFLNNADIKFPTIKDDKNRNVQLSHGLYSKLLESRSETVRKDAYRGVYKTYGDLKNTFSSTLTGVVKTHNFSADVRGYKSSRHAALSANFIPEDVYDALIDAVSSQLGSLHKYVDLRKKALKLDKVHMYDLYVPMVEDVQIPFTFEAAKEIVLESLAPLGQEYQEIVKKAYRERWIDHVENQHKRSGAYSSGTYGTNPYILMNWQDTLNNMFTLTHELGHSVHSYYTRNNQPFVYGDYSIFLAEIASTTNENLLTHHLLNKYDDDKTKAYIINHYLDGVKGTVFRQTQFAEFEHLIHTSDKNGIPLTAEYLSKEYSKINKKYYGDAMTYDDEISLEWARIPHFYYNYYVYQYATGFSAASAFSSKIIKGDGDSVARYIEYLKAGSSDFPIEVLKKAGVDMTTNQPVLATLDTFAQRLGELQSIL